MFKGKKVFVGLAMIALIGMVFGGCASVRQQEMINLGDETKKKNVVAKVEHFDWMGIGFTGETIANEYNRAVDEAFKLSPPDTKKLLNVKAFKAYKTWPIGVGMAIMEVGTLITAVGSITSGGDDSFYFSFGLGLLFDIGGALVMGLNMYDLYVVAEPSNE